MFSTGVQPIFWRADRTEAMRYGDLASKHRPL